MTQSTKYEISTKEFFSIFDDQTNKEEYLNITKAIDRLRSNTSNPSYENINLDHEDIETCFKETEYEIIQLIETDNISTGLNEIIHDSISGINTENSIQHIIIHFTIHPSVGLIDIVNSMELINKTAHEDADVCFCISYNKSRRIKQIEIDSFVFY